MDHIRVDGVVIEEVGASEHDHVWLVLAGQAGHCRQRMELQQKVADRRASVAVAVATVHCEGVVGRVCYGWWRLESALKASDKVVVGTVQQAVFTRSAIVDPILQEEMVVDLHVATAAERGEDLLLDGGKGDRRAAG